MTTSSHEHSLFFVFIESCQERQIQKITYRMFELLNERSKVQVILSHGYLADLVILVDRQQLKRYLLYEVKLHYETFKLLAV
jgi:hypothetical protein